VESKVELPDKLYFKIGEVTNIVGVKQHVLRYWESEFPNIRPQKSKANQRLYRRKDVEAVIAIKHLLYDKKFTIEGARKYLKTEGIAPSLPEKNSKEVAEAARKKALEEVSEKVSRAVKGTREYYEKELLNLKQQIDDFIKSVE
jgi:DNA-binding transcriptional MerR regulator